MIKTGISRFLRNFGLLYTTDRIRYYFEKFRNRKVNKNFKQNFPEVKLPPDYLIYESFQINYSKYFIESSNTAKWLADFFRKYIDLNARKILDWGCGPGRIIRHLPNVIDQECEFFGTDYNKKSIEWCTRNLPEILFNINTLAAELPYADNFFDIIYGISVFTHLSEQMHYDWYKELNRILLPGGIMFLTTQGDNFKDKLTNRELIQYNEGMLIVRGNVKEGHRTFSAFHPASFMLKLFAEVEILEHIETKPETGKWLPQDIWIIRKVQ